MKGIKDAIRDHTFINPRVTPLTDRGLNYSLDFVTPFDTRALRDIAVLTVVDR